MKTTLTRAVASALQELEGRLDHGIYRLGARLPAERELAVQVGVSRSTLRHALQELARRGRVEASPSSGWVVTDSRFSDPPSTLQSFSELGQARGLKVGGQVLQQQVRSATLDEAERLALAPGSPVFELVRLRTLDDIPIVHVTEILPAALVGDMAGVDMTDRSLFHELDQHGIRLERSTFEVQAINADAETAGWLGIEPGAAVLQGDEVSYGSDSRPLLLGLSCYRGDAYRFRADLFRAKS